MTMTINGSGTIVGLNPGGLPDASITTAEIADLNVTPAKLSQKLTLGTAITSATGSSLDFADIPSWVERITISLNNISFAALGAAVVRLGVSNTLVTSGYTAARISFTTSPATVYTSVTDGIASFGTSATAATVIGHIVLTNLTGNQWVASGQVTRTTDNICMTTAGSITLAGALTNLSVVAITSTFDAGSINIMYE
jgi:hypothetical protein